MNGETIDFRPNMVVTYEKGKQINVISFPDHSSKNEMVILYFPYCGSPEIARNFARKNGLKPSDNNILDKEKGYMHLGIKTEFYIIETTGHKVSNVPYASALLLNSDNSENNKVKNFPEENLGGPNDFFVYEKS